MKPSGARPVDVLITDTEYRVNGLERGDFMLSEFIPECPRLHPGMMVPDDSPQYDREWVCRCCGTRLYPNGQGGVELPQIPTESVADPLNGRPREDPGHRRQYIKANPNSTRTSKDLGGRNGRGGKWYE